MLLPSFIATSDKFVDWKALLAVWVEQINRYCSSIANDNPYWHGEQANVAFLTGAAFQLPGWFSLTEFPSAKDNPELIHAYGRNDAWLKSPQCEYFIEAKHTWLELNQPDGISVIPLSMAAAMQDAQHIRVEPLPTTASINVHRVALVFTCPRYIAHPSFSVDVALQQLQHGVQQQSYDALAWTFPPQSYSYTSARTSKIYPGVILLAKAT
jgi:hypothetical protein